MEPKGQCKILVAVGGFRTIPFDMEPKELTWSKIIYLSFGTILFNMVPKGHGNRSTPEAGFGAILFVTTLNERIQCFYFYQNMAYYYYE